MITHIQLEWLAPGSLPIYDTADGFGGASYFNLDIRNPEEPIWREQSVPRTCCLIVPTEIDTFLDTFKQKLPDWLRMLDRLGDGCLFFPIRHVTSHIVEEGPLVLVGLTFLPFPREVELWHDIGTPLQGADPLELIRQVVSGDDSHPIAVEARRLQNERWHYVREIEARIFTQQKAAEAKSLRLLNDCLSETQRHDLVHKKGFNVRGQDGQEYFIAEAPHQNVYLIENGQSTMRFCLVMGQSGIPLYDLLLAQKLVLESDIARFMALSNKWDVDPLTKEWRQAILPIDPNANPAWFERDQDHGFQDLLAEIEGEIAQNQMRAAV